MLASIRVLRDLSLPRSLEWAKLPATTRKSGMSAQPLCNMSEPADRRMNATTITPGRPDMTADTIPAAALPKPPSMNRLIVAATIGNVFEWFDFVVYGFFAVTLAAMFFPTGDPTVSLLVTFGAFGLAYVVRPLGAIVVGGYTDRAGRKAGLLLSMALMMIGTTHDGGDAGLRDDRPCGADHHHDRAALAGIFGRRRVRQRRHVPRRAWRRAPRVQRQLAIRHRRHHHGSRLDLRRRPDDLVDHQQLVDWGWRIPYFFGMLIGPAGLYVRSKVVDTPEFIAAEKPETIPIKDLLRRHPLPVLLALGISIISNSSFYLMLYIPTFGIKQLHLPEYTGFVATLVGGLILAIGCPLAGHWSDKTARPRIMVIMCGLFVLTSYPAFYLMVAWPSLAACVIAVAWLQGVKAGYSGVLPSLMSEQFPVETRAIGVSLSYQHSVTIFGGFAPAHRDLADRADRQPAVTELLPDLHRAAQPQPP